MTTPITDRERALSAQIDEQGGQLAAWRDRAIAAEAELARLRAQVPVGWIGPSGFTHNTATNRMWMRESPKLAAKLSPVYAAPPAQPAEPVQRLSDEQIDAILHEAGVDEFAAIPIEYDRQVARAIESALQPGWRDIETPPGWKLVPICLTPEMREVLLMADRFTVGEVYIMLLAAAPKATK